MKYFNILAVAVAGIAIAVATVPSDADQHKGATTQDRTQDQAHAQIQKEDRLHEKEQIRKQDPSGPKDEDIYGHKLMSPEELNRYREQLRLMKTHEERVSFEAQHREEMQQRAKALNVELEDAK